MGNQQDWLDSTWTTAQYYLAAWMRGEVDGERKYVCAGLSPFTVHLQLLQHYLLISYTPIQNTKFNIFKKKSTNWVAQKKKEVYFLIFCSLEVQTQDATGLDFLRSLSLGCWWPFLYLQVVPELSLYARISFYKDTRKFGLGLTLNDLVLM